jgi:nucleoside-diphosphate-sugar epimerase
MTHVLFFGLGYSAKALATRIRDQGYPVSATYRSEDSRAEIERLGYRSIAFDALNEQDLVGVTHGVVSAPPGAAGDPVLLRHRPLLQDVARQFAWFAYLSTTGVYGNQEGGWVDESSPLIPNTERGERRLAAEEQWLSLWRDYELPLHIFRLAGIYGPGRNQLEAVAAGTARRIIKPGQIFGRIHVEDLASVLEASMARPNPGSAYNVCDDEPCPPQEVVSFAAKLLGLPEPPAIPFEEAQLSPMAASFYADSKRVVNDRIKRELGVVLRYPSYREGLAALLPGLGAKVG